jgi:ankyrin repeat protein
MNSLPGDNDPAITLFKPLASQWEINDVNIKRTDPATGETILHNYCKCINTTPLAVFKYLVEKSGCDLNLKDFRNDTPLYYALQRFNPADGGNIDVLIYLLSQESVNINANCELDRTLLHIACENINILPIDVFQCLIETKGFDVNIRDNQLNTPLHCAFIEFDTNHGGDVSTLIYLLSQTNANVNIRGRFGRTLLHWACIDISILPFDVFKYLIEVNRADINILDKNDNFPLFFALRDFKPNRGNTIAVLTYLLYQDSIDINIKGNNGCTLLHLACEYINKLPIHILQHLIETKGADVSALDQTNNTPIHYAIRDFEQDSGGDMAALTYVFGQKNVNVNVQGRSGRTLLHLACLKINKFPIDIFRCLIETQNCDVNARDSNNETPIRFALRSFDPARGDTAVLTCLLNQSGLDVNFIHHDGFTLLHLACLKINKFPIDVFKCLVETHGADLNILDTRRNTPIHTALDLFDPNSGDFTILTYLLGQKGVNLNIKGPLGCTLTHSVCKHVNKFPSDVFQGLIETMDRADFNLQNDGGSTPLHYALYYFKLEYDITGLTYLLNHNNVDIKVRTRAGHTLLHLPPNAGHSRLGEFNTPYRPRSLGKDEEEGLLDNFWSNIIEIVAERCVKLICDEQPSS